MAELASGPRSSFERSSRSTERDSSALLSVLRRGARRSRGRALCARSATISSSKAFFVCTACIRSRSRTRVAAAIAVGAAVHQIARREHGAFAHRRRRRLPPPRRQLRRVSGFDGDVEARGRARDPRTRSRRFARCAPKRARFGSSRRVVSSAYDDRADDNVALLQRMLQKRQPAGERCDFCSTPLTPEHSHLIELAARRILCACRPCYIVFEPAGAAQGKYRPIPARYVEVDGFCDRGRRLGTALAIPIGLAFFFYNSFEKKMVAFYPSPAGATESLLPARYVGRDRRVPIPLLASIEPDVEAILIQRTPRRARAASSCRSTPRTSWSASFAARGKASTAVRRRTSESTSTSRSSLNGAAVE